MVNAVCQTVIDCLVDNGINRRFAELVLKKGITNIGESMESIERDKMITILELHVRAALQLFVNEEMAKKIINSASFQLKKLSE